MSMGLLGDVSAAQVPTVAVDNSHFSLIGNAGVRVPTIAIMADHMDMAPPGVYLGPFWADAPGTEVVRPRITQVIPAKYASVLVHRTGVTATTAYTELYGMLEADDMLDTCADILTWLRVAATARGGAGEQAPLPAVVTQFSLVFLPANISEYVADKVGRDLPGRRSTATARATIPGDSDMSAAVRQLAETLGAERGAREARGVTDAYKETHAVLQRFCHVDNVDGLAPIWSRLARGVKCEVLSILQQEMNRVCIGRGLGPDIYCPTVSSKLKQLVTGLAFVGHGQDDITSGCQPFLVVYTEPEDHYRAMESAAIAEQLDRGTTNASLADIREIRDKERIKMPQDLNQVSYTLRRFAVLTHALFQGPGATNPFVESVWLLANTFNDRLPDYLHEHHKLRGTAWYDVYPAHVLRYVQVSIYYEYTQMLQSTPGGDHPPLPSCADLYRNLQRGSFHTSAEWLPLPPSITAEAAVSAVPTPTGTAAVVERQARAAVSVSGSASLISGLTATTTDSTARTRSVAPSGSTGTYVANPAQYSVFDALQLRPGMRQLLHSQPPPRNDNNEEFCASWWGRGGCYTNCRRAATHRTFASAAERTRLLTHVRTHLTMPVSASAAGNA